MTELLLEKDYLVYGIISRSSSINTKRIDHLFEHSNLKLKYGDLSDGTCLLQILLEIKENHTVRFPFPEEKEVFFIIFESIIIIRNIKSKIIVFE